MTNRDRELQNAFDRHLRGDGPPPETDGDPEAAAYEAVYAGLEEVPEGELPNDFAQRVADRVDMAPESGMGWAEILLLFLLVAGAGAGLVLMPPTLAGMQQSLGTLLLSFQDLSEAVRIDIIVASTLVLILTIGLDALLRRLRMGPRSMML